MCAFVWSTRFKSGYLAKAVEAGRGSEKLRIPNIFRGYHARVVLV